MLATQTATSVSKFVEHGNYIEIVMCDDDSSGQVIDSSITDSVFFKLLNDIRGTNTVYFQKQYKEFIYRNMTYENNEKFQVKVYKKTLTAREKCDNTMTLVYHKEKLPYHSFPCTTMIHSIAYVSKVTFKINNRVYLNFERRRYPNDARAYNKVYINYNHDENVDMANIDASVKQCFSMLKW